MELPFIRISCIFVIYQLNLMEVKSQVFSCPKSWLNFKMHCYQFIDKPMNWTNAQDFCKKEEGYLASVTSLAENDFISAEMKCIDDRFYWLGGTDSEVEGIWKWESGETWNFTAWATFEPNNAKRGQNCLLLSCFGYQWLDYYCDDLNPFVCEVSSIYFTKSTITVTSNASEALTTSTTDKICTSKLTAILLLATVVSLQIVTLGFCLISMRRRRNTDMARSGLNSSDDQANGAMIYLTAPTDQASPNEYEDPNNESLYEEIPEGDLVK